MPDNSDDYENLKLLSPDLDCGYCGNASCTAFIRRIYFEKEKIHNCPFLSKEKRKRMENIISKKRKKQPSASTGTKKTGKSGKSADQEISRKEQIQFSPCAEKEKVTMEVKMPLPSDNDYSLLDSCDMCITIGRMKTMDNIRCSKEMGYAAAVVDDKRIHIFKNGKVILRKADSKKDGFRILKKLRTAMKPSVINRCGNTFSDCLLSHPVRKPHSTNFLWGIPEKTKKDYKKERENAKNTKNTGNTKNMENTEKDQKGEPNIGLPVVSVMEDFINELVKELSKKKDKVSEKIGEQVEQEEEQFAEIRKVLDFFTKLPYRLNEIPSLLSSDKENVQDKLSEIYSSAIEFQSTATALAIERSILKPGKIEVAFYGVVVHGTGMTVQRSVQAVVELVRYFLSDDESPETESLFEKEFVELSAYLIMLFRDVFSLFSEIMSGKYGDGSGLVKAVRKNTEKLEKEFAKVRASLKEFTTRCREKELPVPVAQLWKLFNNTLYLLNLPKKEIPVP